jgi:hypothetical protein
VANVQAVKAGSPPFTSSRMPKAAALLWGSNDVVDGLDDCKQWSISPTLPASAFRALYEDIPESAWLTIP